MKLLVRNHGLWLVVLATGLCAIYLPGLSNQLVFDDLFLLRDGLLRERYGELLPLKQRLLSYGSFVWVEAVWGEGWWKQRVVNLVLHLLTALALYGFIRDLLRHVRWPQDVADDPASEASIRAALQVGVLLFAFNPVAVYAVSYLIQRSIVSATLFTVLALWSFLRGLTSRNTKWFVLAVFAYVIALLCKEYALMAPAVAFAIYVFVERPAPRKLCAFLLATGVLIGAMIALLLKVYGEIIGVPFDEFSRIYIDQLTALDPGIMDKAWPLSMLNQAALFFFYGLLWIVPVVSWMSIDLRPPFPVSWSSWPHLLGAIGFLSLAICAFVLLVRSSGVGRFVGVCLLMPMLLFATEFSTVWIQDPFVLYRSYLWAIALPGLFVVVFVGLRPGLVLAVGIVVSALFAGLAFERSSSLQSRVSVWSDAAAKTDLFDSPSAVGRWRPFLNLGGHYLELGMPEAAITAFSKALELGERRGEADYSIGVAMQMMGDVRSAVLAFEAAESKGLTRLGALYVNRGEVRFALGRLQEAASDFDTALGMRLDENTRMHALRKGAEVSLAIGDYSRARERYAELLVRQPDDYEVRLGDALAQAALGKGEQALAELDALLLMAPNPSAHYGRAIALHQLGELEEAMKAVNSAIRLQPDNSSFLVFRDRLIQAVRSGLSATATTGSDELEASR